MASKAPILVQRDTLALTFNRGDKREITATIAVKHYSLNAFPGDEVLEIELVKHGSTTKTVGAMVDRDQLVKLAHWLLHDHNHQQGGA
ncbi:hypothetical protein [Corynebacterium sp. ES2775-CONJ]|uniref:hypothetical protein n=1 Tax=Corynebacterium sp. ES2775-CONJ TaxID=2974029 RepID=UPI002169B29E|nr:hypothetical protein [Corynebacterium sp. ES2775-CONJ]MCS4489427.1 hypothetical protein [Corynebacterium sp. ES2775-CONJ]